MSPHFQYHAKEGPDKIVEGAVDADNYDQAVNAIVLKGLTPLEIKENISPPFRKKFSTPISTFPLNKKVSKTDLVIFTRQMSDLLGASVTILKALRLIAGQTQNKELKNVVNEIGGLVQNGAALSQALKKFDGIFPAYYINMVHAGEVAGNLEVILDRLAGYLEKEQEISGKVASSLAYPLFVLIIGFITVFILLSFVIPRLTVMFEDFDQSLPLITTMLISLSGFFLKFWWLMILAGFIAFRYFYQWLKTEEGKKRFDTFLLKLWIVGPFIQIVEVGRFARALGTLMESGVTIVTALETAANITGNSLLKNELENVSREVAKGNSLGKALKNVSYFPEMAINMITTSEESGRLENGLYKIATVYERESERMMKTAVSLLGPVVLTAVIVFIGFVVISIVLPILQMNQLIQ